ncbi:MAG: ABC transporter ATP-binding protein [Pseudomonadota bacterium]
MTLAVRCRSIGKQYTYGDRQQSVLDNFSLTVDPGQSMALLGRSGSGKSTLLNLLAGLDDVDTGDVLLGDFSIARAPEPSRTRFRRHNIGFVYQSFNLLPTLSVADNVRLMLDLIGVQGQAARQSTAAVLSSVGLLDAADRYPDTLSGGEQQRVAIARALVHQPGLILADEPTGNLDAENADRVADLLLRLVAERGCTLILATHSGRLAERCQQQLDLSQGRGMTR